MQDTTVIAVVVAAAQLIALFIAAAIAINRAHITAAAATVARCSTIARAIAAFRARLQVTTMVGGCAGFRRGSIGRRARSVELPSRVCFAVHTVDLHECPGGTWYQMTKPQQAREQGQTRRLKSSYHGRTRSNRLRARHAARVYGRAAAVTSTFNAPNRHAVGRSV